MSLPDGERPEIAMVSRIRVEVRGETMEAAEKVAFAALGHARMAGLLEGYVPQIGSYTDHFFNRPNVTVDRGEVPEAWSELGLPYYGRLSFLFEPEASVGGLKQIGFDVAQVAGPDHPLPLPPVSEHGYIVLERQRPVAREYMWERGPLGDHQGETGESILEDIRSIREVLAATARMDKSGASVEVNLDGWSDVHESGESLYEAAAQARKSVIDMLHPQDEDAEEPDEVSIHIANLNAGTLARALDDKEYRTLVVGTKSAIDTALGLLPSARTKAGFEIALICDTNHDPDYYTLTTAELAEERKRRGLDDHNYRFGVTSTGAGTLN